MNTSIAYERPDDLDVLSDESRVRRFVGSLDLFLPAAAARIRVRPISEADFPALTRLLNDGFPSRGAQFWLRVLAALKSHVPPPGYPQYGYVLEGGRSVVGVLLTIFTAGNAGTQTIRCNVSSWYVDPRFRSYASMFAAWILRDKRVTYVNVTPASDTLTILQIHGYANYSKGTFVAVPAIRWDARSDGSESRGRISIHPHRRSLPIVALCAIMKATAASAYGAKRPNGPIPSCFEPAR